MEHCKLENITLKWIGEDMVQFLYFDMLYDSIKFVEMSVCFWVHWKDC